MRRLPKDSFFVFVKDFFRVGVKLPTIYITSLMYSQPGSDSGTTAVVALIRGKQLIVANAGDSRCVVSERGRSSVSFQSVQPHHLRFIGHL